jgi:hypothetical protein
MRQFRGIFLWLVLAAFVLGQGYALAACPMRAAGPAVKIEAAAPMACHAAQQEAAAPGDEAPQTANAASCLCAMACQALAPPPRAAQDVLIAKALTRAPEAPARLQSHVRGLDPPIPRTRAA